MIRPRITETIGALGRAVKSAGLEFGGVDRILLVGGTSRIPLVAEMVREATGRPVAIDAHPKHSMALGAAFIAEERRRAALAASGAAVVDATAWPVQPRGRRAAVAGAGDMATARLRSARSRPLTAPEGWPGRNDRRAPRVAGPGRDRTARRGRAAACRPAVAVAGAGGSGRGRIMAAVAAIGAIVLVAILAVGASGMLSGGSGPSNSPLALASAGATPSAAPAPTATPVPTPEPTATPLPTATPVPTPTPTPSGRAARILGITISGGNYVVDFKVFGYTPVLPGRHVHFFFDTVKPADAGVPGKGPWKLYATPNPFTQYKVSDRPSGAKQMCILVANADHSVVQSTGNCVDLPS